MEPAAERQAAGKIQEPPRSLLQLAIVLIEVDEKKPPKMWYSLLSISSFAGITAENPKQTTNKAVRATTSRLMMFAVTGAQPEFERYECATA